MSFKMIQLPAVYDVLYSCNLAQIYQVVMHKYSLLAIDFVFGFNPHFPVSKWYFLMSVFVFGFLVPTNTHFSLYQLHTKSTEEVYILAYVENTLQLKANKNCKLFFVHKSQLEMMMQLNKRWKFCQHYSTFVNSFLQLFPTVAITD